MPSSLRIKAIEKLLTRPHSAATKKKLEDEHKKLKGKK